MAIIRCLLNVAYLVFNTVMTNSEVIINQILYHVLHGQIHKFSKVLAAIIIIVALAGEALNLVSRDIKMF